VPQFDTKPYDPKKLRQKIRSNIAKFEYIDDSNILNLQVRNLEDKIWSRKIDGSTYQLNYTLSNGEKMDINFIAAYNETRQKYKKGTYPDGDIPTLEDIQALRELLLRTQKQLQNDYQRGVFENFQPYLTSYGYELKSIEDAINFNNAHEAMHLGTIKALNYFVK